MHRGLIIATIQFYFTVTFYFVDLPIFNGFLTFGYSTFFTNLPVIAIIMDEDLDFTTMRRFPILYREPQRGLKMSLKRFFVMLAESVFQVEFNVLSSGCNYHAADFGTLSFDHD